MPDREWFISEALSSVRRLSEIIGELSDTELLRVIEIEEAALRRKHVLDKLYRQQRVRARKLYETQLKEKQNGSCQFHRSDPR